MRVSLTLNLIIPKPLLIDSTTKNTSRKVYLESLAYRAENFRKSFYLLGRAQPVIPPNLYSIMLMNIIAWGPQVSFY